MSFVQYEGYFIVTVFSHILIPKKLRWGFDSRNQLNVTLAISVPVHLIHSSFQTLNRQSQIRGSGHPILQRK